MTFCLQEQVYVEVASRGAYVTLTAHKVVGDDVATSVINIASQNVDSFIEMVKQANMEAVREIAAYESKEA